MKTAVKSVFAFFPGAIVVLGKKRCLVVSIERAQRDGVDVPEGFVPVLLCHETRGICMGPVFVVRTDQLRKLP